MTWTKWVFLEFHSQKKTSNTRDLTFPNLGFPLPFHPSLHFSLLSTVWLIAAHPRPSCSHVIPPRFAHGPSFLHANGAPSLLIPALFRSALHFSFSSTVESQIGPWNITSMWHAALPFVHFSRFSTFALGPEKSRSVLARVRLCVPGESRTPTRVNRRLPRIDARRRRDTS